MRSAARSAGRLLAVLGVVAATLGAPAPTAEATSDVQANPTLLQSNWYWHHLIADAPVVPPVAVPNEPSNVPDGDLPVASLDGKGERSKVFVVAFDLAGAGPGSSISAFTVTLTVDPNAHNITTENPKLAAGLALRNWANGTTGDSDTVNAPPVEGLVDGVWSADGKTISFAVPQVAQAWVDDTNFGLEVVPAVGYTTPFQVSFSGGDKVKAAMTYTPAVVEPPTTPDTSGSNPGTGLVGGSAPPPVSSGPIGTGSTGLSGPPSVGGSSVPPPAIDTNQGQPTPTTVVPAAQALPSLSDRPTNLLFWSGVGFAALLVLLSLILGGEPQSAAATRSSRLTTVLRTRGPAATRYSAPA